MKARHALIAGDSGGGKTTLLREIHVRNSPSVWINHNSESVPSGHQDPDTATSVRSLPELEEAIAEGYESINYRVESQETGIEHARSVGYHRCNHLQVIVDEAQNVLPRNSTVGENELKTGIHEDRDAGIYYRIASQDPNDIDRGAVKQCEYICWVGPWAEFHRGFFQFYNVPTKKLPTDRFRYVVLDKRMEIIYEGETKEEFA